MAISLKVLAPNKNVYQGEAEEVILPSTTGQLGVLPGHISLVTAIDIIKQPNHRLIWLSRIEHELSENRGFVKRIDPVSYTHLTLPTSG